MYVLTLNVLRPKSRKWGDFELRKSFKVTKDGNAAGVFGVVVQEIDKKTQVFVDGTELTTSAQIQDFTTGQVEYATHKYYELFPILNGEGCDGAPDEWRDNCIDDQFQNGGIVPYVLERDPETGKDEYYVADNASSRGTITMRGTNVFIPTDEKTARAVFAAADAPARLGASITVLGTRWSLSPKTPANGLPYSRMFTMPPGPYVVHNVDVSWDERGKTKVISKVVQQGGRRARTLRNKRTRLTRRK